MIFKMWMGNFKPSSQVTKREIRGGKVRSRMGKMPKRYAGIMPNFRQSGIEQPPSQVIRSADKATIRRVLIETGETDRVRLPHIYIISDSSPQYCLLLSPSVCD